MSTQQHAAIVHTLSDAIKLVRQTLFYGIYVALLPFSLHLLLKRKLTAAVDKAIFSTIVIIYLLSTCNWAATTANFLSALQGSYTVADTPGRDTVWSLVLNTTSALLLVNCILTDGIVVWRAWVLCRDTSKVVLMVPVLLLICFTASVLVALCVKIKLDFPHEGSNLRRLIDVIQVTNLTLSLLTNMSATSIIAYQAWKHRRSIRETLSREQETSTKVEKIFVLLVESGIVYCVSGAIVLIGTVVRLPYGTLGDIYLPVHVQISGIYPTVVLVLVSQQRSLKEGAFSTVGNETAVALTRLGPINFTSNPAATTCTDTYNGRPSDDVSIRSVSSIGIAYSGGGIHSTINITPMNRRPLGRMSSVLVLIDTEDPSCRDGIEVS